MTKFICVLAVPRTGSNLLFSLLSNYRGLNLKHELFHPKWVGKFTDADWDVLADKSDGHVRGKENFARWRAENVADTLEALHESGGGRPLFFKIFPSQLTPETMAEQLFPRRDVSYIVLRRRPIESYISNMKALEVKAYTGTNTTALRPELDTAHFARWAHRTQDWYSWCESQLRSHGRPYTALSYEYDLATANRNDALSRLTIWLRLAKLDVSIKSQPTPLMVKQDSEPNYQNRVANWPEFEAQLAKNPELFQWAVAA